MIFKLFIVSQKSIYTEIFKMAEDSIKAERLSRLEDYFSMYYSPFAWSSSFFKKHFSFTGYFDSCVFGESTDFSISDLIIDVSVR